MNSEEVVKIIDSVRNWSDDCPFKNELKRKLRKEGKLDKTII